MLLLENIVTVADLTLALEEKEALELSNLDNPCGATVDTAKLQYAIDRATEEINGYFVVSGDCGKALIFLNSKNLIIATARYLLDTLKARPSVIDAYERAIKRLKEFSVWDDERSCPLSTEQLEEILGGELTPSDNNFRFSGSNRRWTPCNFKNFQKRLYDSKSTGSAEQRINKTYPIDEIG